MTGVFRRVIFRLLWVGILITSPVTTAWGLQPKELLLLVNRQVPAAKELAAYYQQKRGIPEDNLLLLDLPEAETLSRKVYQENLVTPLLNFLGKRQKAASIRGLVLFYGIPMRVSAPEVAASDRPQWEALQNQRKKLGRQLDALSQDDSRRPALKNQLAELKKKISRLIPPEQGAAVDSELTLVLNHDYSLERWQPNPYFVPFQKQRDQLAFGKDQVLMVARLDGPTPAIVRRMIDDSLAAEAVGLQGRAYFDARWAPTKDPNPQGYALYDRSLQRAAGLTEKLTRLSMVLDQQERLFQPGEAPEAAIYAGWYSLAKYVDAFDWRPGAVAYHMASSECTTLKRTGSQVWCKRLLEDGVAATIGPVAEPYIQGFPLPELFFGYLYDGYYSLMESYFLSLPFLSWQMILVGDPLYRPFRNGSQPPQASENLK